MKAPLVHVAEMVFNQPLAIMPEKLEVILRAIGSRLLLDETQLNSLFTTGTSIHPQWVNSGFVGIGTSTGHVVSQPLILIDPTNGDQPKQQNDKPYKLTSEGVAVIPIRGTLMKRFSFVMAQSGSIMSYQAIGDAVYQALSDPAVKGVLFDVDSPGGSTHGCFELSEMLHGMRGEKPIWAISNDLAASAAYALASAASRLLVTRTGGVGSIGVFALHADQSGQDEQQGIKYTYIFAGDKKIDGNPHAPLSKSARADIQTEVDRENEMFVQCVARNRGSDPQRIKNLEAAVLYGDTAEGVLADYVATYDEALAELTAYVNKRATKITVAPQTFSDNNALNGATMQLRNSADVRTEVPAIAPHKTATSEKPWDGPRAKANLRLDQPESYYRKAYAYQESGADPKTKDAYKFIHHEVSGSGEIGAANIKACQSSIGILNGGRGGTVISRPDRRGVYRHVAAHLRDAKLEPAPLNSSYETFISGVLESTAPEQLDELRALALQFLLADDAGESTGQEEQPMGTLLTKTKRSEAEAKEAEEMEKNDEEEEDEEDDKKKEEDDDDKKKSESRKSRKSESRKAKKEDDEEEEEDECPTSRRSEVLQIPQVANSAARRIADLCKIAGRPELAVDYITAGYNVNRVIEALSELRSKASSEVGMHSYVTGQAGGDTGAASVDQAIRQAQALEANSGGTLTRSQALEKILRSNPQIYESYCDERDRVIAQCPGGRGQVLTNYVLTSQRRYMQQLGLSTILEDVPGRSH